jgi:hypothetical protein
MSDEPITWKCTWKVDKYKGDWNPLGLMEPYEVVEGKGNLLVIGGASAIWQLVFKTGFTSFVLTQCHVGVGDSATPEADTQTDLQAAVNKTRVASTTISHTDSTSLTAAKTVSITTSFPSGTGGGNANHAWQEWGIFNAASSGRMLNRKVASLGTKTSADTWNLTVTISLA